jgi:apolipoprotein N-acyltransferase
VALLVWLGSGFLVASPPKLRPVGLISLLIPFWWPTPPLLPSPPLKISLLSTNIPQSVKWDKRFIPTEITILLREIGGRLEGGADLVVTPETAFPLPLNRYPQLMERLAQLSHRGAILVGALYEKGGKFYNVGYLFDDGRVTILKKHLLVPFGEYIPLPFLQKEINKIFFGNPADFTPAQHFAQFVLKGVSFIQAICYEVTSPSLYSLPPRYVVALTNNGWFFLPGSEKSLEPILQQLLIIGYSFNSGKMVYHTTNFSGAYVVNRGRIVEVEE